MASLNTLPEEDKAAIRPDIPSLRNQEGMETNTAGKSSGGAGSSTKSSTGGATSSTTGGGFYNDKGDTNESSTGGGSGSSTVAGGAGGLAAAEAAGAGAASTLGKGYNPVESLTGFSKLKSLISGNKRKALIGGGVGGGIAGVIIAGFFFLIPLKIENIVKNLEGHFFSTSKSAISNETDNMFKRYLKDKIGPAMVSGKCARQGKYIISKNCNINVTGNGTNPVENLYRTWNDAKLENMMADKLGIEIRYDTSGPRTFYLKTPQSSSELKVGNSTGIGSEFDAVDRGAVRQTLKDAEVTMTSWDKVMFRYKVGRLLEEKYGIKRCIVYCGAKDALANSSTNKKYAAKMFLVERVITPRSAALGAVADCLLNQNNCGTKQSSTTCTQSTCDELAGAPQTGADSEAAQEVGKVTSTFGTETSDKLIKGITDIRDANGISKYVLGKVLEKIGLQDIAGGLVNWIPKLSQAITTLSTLGPDVKKLNYIVNSGAAVSMYMMYRTYADEVHTGHVDPTEIGSFTKALGPGSQCAKGIEITCGAQVGGTATAESTPLYGALINGKPRTGSASTGLLDNLLPAKAYAATATDTSSSSNNYKCANGKPVPAGKLVCDEEAMGRPNGNPTLSAISDFLTNTPVVSFITHAASVLNRLIKIPSTIFCTVLSTVMSAIGLNTPTFITQAVQPFFTWFLNQLVSSPFAPDMSGGRSFDMIAAGADVSGNDFAHSGLGGQALTPVQAATIINQQQDETQQKFSQQTFFARMFDTNSSYSLVSKVAMDVPFGLQTSAETSVASLMSNPFGALANSFASLFSNKVSAATTAQNDAFGVTQYGYPNGVPSDPETYWNQNCSDNAAQAYENNNNWNDAAAATTDPNTGEPLNATTNACLLIHSSTGSAGGALNTNMLTPDDIANLNGGAGSTSTSTTTAGLTNPFPGGWIPNRLDMGYDGTFKGQIVAPFSGTITYASSSFSNWGGYIELKSDQKITGLPTQTLYFAEGVKPVGGAGRGQHVNAGDPIADPAPSPYGNAYATNSGGVGEIEWGVAVDGSVGTPTNPLAESGVSNAAQMVLDFAKWAEKSLNLPPPSQTSQAGSA